MLPDSLAAEVEPLVDKLRLLIEVALQTSGKDMPVFLPPGAVRAAERSERLPTPQSEEPEAAEAADAAGAAEAGAGAGTEPDSEPEPVAVSVPEPAPRASTARRGPVLSYGLVGQSRASVHAAGVDHSLGGGGFEPWGSAEENVVITQQPFLQQPSRVPSRGYGVGGALLRRTLGNHMSRPRVALPPQPGARRN